MSQRPGLTPEEWQARFPNGPPVSWPIVAVKSLCAVAVAAPAALAAIPGLEIPPVIWAIMALLALAGARVLEQMPAGVRAGRR